MRAAALKAQKSRKTRTPALIDRVRRHRVSIVICNAYLPADLVRSAKMAGIDRDVALRVLNESVGEVGEWPENVVPITGMSGVIAQILRDHFAALATNTKSVGRIHKPRASGKGKINSGRES